MPARYDAVIAGGGLAGLSLAVRLPALRVLIVDDPAATRVQRWGFWSRSPGPLDAAISQRFTTIRLYAQRSERILPVGPYTYNVVRRSDLERVAEKLLAVRPDLDLIEGHVARLRSLGDCAEAVVDGEPIRAAWAFDARGGGPDGPGAPDARLAFAGWEVACGRPCFDPGALTLFDFRTPRHGPARFVYAVPDGATRALVEAVAFVPRHHDPPSTHDLTETLESYLDGVDYSVERREEAVVPLRIRPPERTRGRVVPLGARAGLVKASASRPTAQRSHSRCSAMDIHTGCGGPGGATGCWTPCCYAPWTAIRRCWRSPSIASSPAIRPSASCASSTRRPACAMNCA
jgi:lycopene beta-cyclase